MFRLENKHVIFRPETGTREFSHTLSPISCLMTKTTNNTPSVLHQHTSTFLLPIEPLLVQPPKPSVEKTLLDRDTKYAQSSIQLLELLEVKIKPV